ncbi:polymeric immunoglobulin receptor-like [Triplophysa dalaica]|uniref:polymeric immunoglobulin receptor-like n=1 Tax=Triplophysa dalaica TaxID=1582913 RepID=UPI0024E02FE7|nr:polymeric immunoglobulin receptor-like [Triplophysa dalaica]
MMSPVFGDEGGSAQIICPYDPIYNSTSKKLLKSCTDKNTLMEMNRWSVNDHMTASVFSVNITGLTADDAGKYCCAVTLETDVIYLYTHLIIIIKQELLLNKSEGDNMSMECKHHAEYQKVFCKAHEVSMCVNDGVSLQSIRDDGFSLSDETSTGVFTVNISHLREEHSGIYWCGSHIITKVHLNVTRVSDSSMMMMMIIVCVCVILLLIGGNTLIIVYRFRHNMTPDRGSAQIYHNTQLPTIPSSDDDDVVYAAVSFHKREDSVSDVSVTFRKDEILTEYATVIYCTRLN